MTLYCWIHWFWITFIVSARLLSVIASPVGSYFNQGSSTIPHLYLKSNQNSSKFYLETSSKTAEFNNTSLINTPVEHINQTNELFNRTESNETFSTALPKSQTNVIDSSSKTILEKAASNSTLFVNNSCNECNDTRNSSLIIENFNVQQSFTVNASLKDMDLQESKVNSSLSAAGITGITLGCLGCVVVVTVMVFIVYRNIGFNRPQVLNDHCSNPDSSGYIDDSTLRENSEEMYSLDNDSFLNSLEAMTIQNLWTDTVKHTKL